MLWAPPTMLLGAPQWHGPCLVGLFLNLCHSLPEAPVPGTEALHETVGYYALQIPWAPPDPVVSPGPGGPP